MLAALNAALDSAKLALDPVPPLLASADTAAAAKTDSVAAPWHARRWAVALLAETTAPWGALPVAPATPETRETLGRAATRSLQLEHRFGPAAHPGSRWLVRGGVGETRLQGQLTAITDRGTVQTSVRRDSLVTFLDGVTRRDSSYIIRQDSVPQLNPRINGSGQIIDYDTLWIDRYDTLYQVVVTHDTVRRTEIISTTRLETSRIRREQQLRPTYRFWTIPVAVQFDILRYRRWRAGLGLGAQLLIFRGGEAPVAVADGVALRRIGPRDGPFRPLSVGLTTTLDVRYALSPRLSVLGGAGLRGWLQNPVRGAARGPVLPMAQVGVSWGLGGR